MKSDFYENTLRAIFIPIVERGIQSLARILANSVGTTAPTSVETAPISKKAQSSAKQRKGNRLGRAPLSAAKQKKIREGFEQAMTCKEIAEHAGVSISSAVRYTSKMRNKQSA